MAGQEHQSILKKMVDLFKNKGYTIKCAELSGYNSCSIIGTHVPDMVATNATGLWHIVEVETCESLDTEQTLEQFHEFVNNIMKDDKRKVPFYVGFPKRCETKMSNLLVKEGLQSKVIPIPF